MAIIKSLNCQRMRQIETVKRWKRVHKYWSVQRNDHEAIIDNRKIGFLQPTGGWVSPKCPNAQMPKSPFIRPHLHFGMHFFNGLMLYSLVIYGKWLRKNFYVQGELLDENWHTGIDVPNSSWRKRYFLMINKGFIQWFEKEAFYYVEGMWLCLQALDQSIS